MASTFYSKLFNFFRILRYDQILIVFSLDHIKYMAGITNNVKTKEKIVPPTITTPFQFYWKQPQDIAIGKAPNEIAKLVIRIGRNRA
jgi:hypothetical protein